MQLSSNKFEHLVSLVTKALAVVGLGILMLFAASTLADGLLRGLASAPIDVVRDLGGLVVAIAMACCLPLGMWERHNITITIVDKVISKKGGHILSSFAAAVVAMIMTVIAYQLLMYAGKYARAGERTVMLGIASAPFWYVVATVVSLAAIVQALVMVVEIVRCFQKNAASAPETETSAL